LFVSKDRFAAHLEIIADRAATMGDALALAVHFDDGYRDTFEPALAAARIAGIKVGCFLPSAFVAAGRPFLWDRLRAGLDPRTGNSELAAAVAELVGTQDTDASHIFALATERCRDDLHLAQTLEAELDRRRIAAVPEDAPLAAGQLAAMRAAGIALGLHGHTHRSFARLCADDFTAEIDTPFRWVKDLLGRCPDAFAFPYGSRRDWNADAVAHLSSLGVQRIYSAVATPAQLAGHDLLPRWAVGDLDRISFADRLDELIGRLLNPGHGAGDLDGLLLQGRFALVATSRQPA
jgi:peptidoglycan/xylan/chitin deacetylase (PgdA/CDA1 family)